MGWTWFKTTALVAVLALTSHPMLAQKPLSDQDLWARAVQPNAEIVRSPVMTRPEMFNAMPVDADALTGSFLSNSDITSLVAGRLFEEAGYQYARDRLMYYDTDGTIYSVNKEFFIARQPPSGDAGVWKVTNGFLCLTWRGGTDCLKIRKTGLGHIVRVDADNRPVWRMTSRKPVYLADIKSTAVAASGLPTFGDIARESWEAEIRKQERYRCLRFREC